MSTLELPKETKKDIKPFSAVLEEFKRKLDYLFTQRMDPEKQNLNRGIPPYILQEVLKLNPMASSIPQEYGGRGADPKEILSLLEAASYRSLPLSLMMGISGALFSEPLAKYGEESVKQTVFSDMLKNGKLGGLMITEPDFGTDALGMQTYYSETPYGYSIKGEKHWAGLSGHADYWLMTARKKKDDGVLNRDIDFFLADSSKPEQMVRAEEYYNNLGLYFIPYAKNKVDILVPAHHRLKPKTTGIKLMQDLLHRSRMRFPGMAAGFLHRMLDEALDHVKKRFVGGRPLIQYDQVQNRIQELQAWFTASNAFQRNAAKISGIVNDLVGEGLIANVHKTMLSEMMQKASQSLLTLVGAKGYRQDHVAGRATTDSRPFMIFEGSNDVIFTQIADAFLKGMKRAKVSNVLQYIKDHPLTQKSANFFEGALNFKVADLPQRKKVQLGEALGYMVTADLTLDLADSGYNTKLIDNALSVFKENVSSLVMGVLYGGTESYAEDYNSNIDWAAGLV